MDEPENAPDEIIFVAGSTDEGRRAASNAIRAAFPDGMPGRLRPDRVVHASLLLAGTSADPRTVPIATETAALVWSPPFELVFDTVVGFGGANGVLALTCSKIPDAWSVLRKQLSQVPRRLRAPTEGGATPHLTMAYGCPTLPATRLAEPVIWAVDAFVLVHSLRGLSEHRELGRWMLR